LEYVQICVYYNLDTDTGTRTGVNVNAPLGFFEEVAHTRTTTTTR